MLSLSASRNYPVYKIHMNMGLLSCHFSVNVNSTLNSVCKLLIASCGINIAILCNIANQKYIHDHYPLFMAIYLHAYVNFFKASLRVPKIDSLYNRAILFSL